MPGAEGSPEQRVVRLESELKQARNEIAALQASGKRSRPGQTLGDGLRSLAQDIREGRPVTPDDLFRNFQPLLRDLAPLFERIRIREAGRQVDSLTGELTRKYNLTPAQQESLKEWFKQKAERDAKDWSAMVGSNGTTLEDIARASRNVRPDEGLDAFMAKTLSGDKLADFQNQRMVERTSRVEQEADMRMERLNGIVQLDESQKDQVFGIMARGSSEYDPSMKLVGSGEEIDAGLGAGDAAALAVLRPEQRAAYDAEHERRRAEAQKQMNEIGLSLPENWDALDH
ncbi:MAG: hypothetical protein JWO82_41, partial [Akkermansiaceae bacterium]|nr:hypothetical protein [Akkermansiaceae bacterium]